MSIKAKFAGVCPLCHIRFRVGIDWIENRDGKWVHVQCPTANQSALGTSVKHGDFEQYYKSLRPVKPVHYQAEAEVEQGLADIERKKKASIDIPLSIEDHSVTIDTDVLDNIVSELGFVAEPEPREEVKSFIPSQYQSAIFDAIVEIVREGFFHIGELIYKHLVIEAVAGSGKTTTITKALELIPSHFKVAFLAFNKHIANELKHRAPSFVHVSTLHSLGLSVMRKFNSKVKVENDKVGLILDDIWPVSKQAVNEGKITDKEKKINYLKRLSMRKLVSICKSTLANVSDVQAVLAIIDRYGVEIDTDFQDEIIGKLPEVIERCKADTDTVDFDDMIWLPVALQMKLERFDFLMVDEAQDMNKLQIDFILNSVSADGHIIAVGDRHQSLYGFRGADTEAIQNIIESLKAGTLPLSVTYRCPSKHVELARQIVPILEPRENAPEGKITELDYFDLAKQLKANDMVICRTDAPLIRPAFECIRMGKKAMIRGKDIGESLINLIKRFEKNDLGAFETSLAEYYEHEYTKLMDKGKEMQALLLQDRVETLRFIINECSTVAELMSKIDLLFSDNNAGIVFSSVHRAKGLEAERVFILRPDLMPHKKAKKDWERQQEMNCKYVAQTRSKNELVFVIGDGGV